MTTHTHKDIPQHLSPINLLSLLYSRDKAEQDATNKRTKQQRAGDGQGNKREYRKIRARSL